MPDATDGHGSDLLTLAADFPAPTREAWMKAVRGVILKSRPDATEEEAAEAFARQLVAVTEDGIEIQPLYTAADGVPDPGRPGFAPFVRATHAAPVAWEIRQRVWIDIDGSRAVRELESGSTGVLLDLDAAATDASALSQALDGVLLDLAPVSLDARGSDDGVALGALLIDLWDDRGLAAADRRGTLGAAPLAAHARSGGTTDLDASRAAAAALVLRAATSAPQARVVVADGTVWHDAGATDAQELAWNIAAAASEVRALVDNGVALEVACARLEMRWAATADQFATIAKLRAARRLWARVAEIAGLGVAQRASFHHAETSRPMLTRYDPWVNALRSTVACFAAAVGGADAITVLPHDSARVHGGTGVGRRTARNTQTVLQMESNLSRVVDPAGGSYFVERFTDDLARVAWAELQAVEAAGGIVEALRSGHVHQSLDRALTARAKQVATRRRALTGLSEFPDIGEEPPPPIDAPSVHAETPFAPLALHRLAEDFEGQRGRADEHTRSTGARPTIVLATIGTPAAYTARATFAKNLFEAGGIVTKEADIDAYDSSISDVVCLCSSDAAYAEQGAAAVERVRAKGARRVYLAGRKVGLDGVDEEVGMGSDVLDVLTRALDELGVSADKGVAR